MYDVIKTASDFLWNYLLIFLLVGTGVFFTIRLRFVQIRKFREGMGMVFGGFTLRGKAAGEHGMSSFQSLATAIAAQVGTGNLAGAATAMISGGPGAVFWIWVSAFFGMATIFAEATLAQKFKTTLNGKAVGGPVYYIRQAFNDNALGKVMAGIFAVLIIFALGFMGNMVQANSVGDAFQVAFGLKPLYMGIFLAIVGGFIFLGGVKRIASFAEKVVPIMTFGYVIGAGIILIAHVGAVPAMFHDIFVGAFNPTAVVGGGLGIGVQQAIRFGVARGLFSNEAGMGSTPHAHAIANVKHPCDQGFVAMIGVFIDSFIVLTMTTMVIMVTGVLPQGFAGVFDGIGLTQFAFESYYGFGGSVFVAICTLFFAFTTIVGWYFFGESNVRYLFGEKAVPTYAIIVLIAMVIGSTLRVDMVWLMADFFNGLMVIPNLIAIILLSGLVAGLLKENEKSKEK